MSEIMLWVIGLLIASGLIWLVKLIFFRPSNVDLFFERIMLRFALGYPEILSMLRIFEKMGIHSHNKKLNDESDEFQQKQNARIEKDLKILRSYPDWKIKPNQKLSYDIMEWYLADIVESKKFMYHNYPVNQLFGVQNQLPSFMASTHQINNKRDAKYYIIRLNKFKKKFYQVKQGLETRAEKGIVPPLFVFEKVLDEMKNFIASPAVENFLYKNMEEKLSNLSSLREEDRKELLEDTKKAIQNSVYPAYQILIDTFTDIKVKANTEAGVWKFPDGEAYYKYILKHYTTTELTPEEIHNIGLSEVHRIQGQMAEILETIGYTGKPVMEIMEQLSKEDRFLYEESEESREQVLKDYQGIIERVDNSLEHLFNTRPKAKVNVERIPKFKEKTAPGAYYQLPAMDGSRPGVFFANLLKLPVKFDMETLAIHEAIPGHHFQLAIQQELKGIPTFRKVIPFTAYAEGWALYTEKLAYENDIFSDDYSVLGYLKSELFRAVRLVVDTGIHYKKWSREEAIEYMLKNTGVDETNVIIEIERYIVMPGQATAYKIGELEILRLRDKAKEKLGEKFDIRQFHDVILKNGSVPLKILESLIDDYIISRK